MRRSFLYCGELSTRDTPQSYILFWNIPIRDKRTHATSDEMDIDLVALAREIALRMDPDALLDSKDVAAMLKCSPRYVVDHYMGSRGFPKAVRLPAPKGGKGHPRWLRSDLTSYIDALAHQPRRHIKRTNNPVD